MESVTGIRCRLARLNIVLIINAVFLTCGLLFLLSTSHRQLGTPVGSTQWKPRTRRIDVNSDASTDVKVNEISPVLATDSLPNVGHSFMEQTHGVVTEAEFINWKFVNRVKSLGDLPKVHANSSVKSDVTHCVGLNVLNGEKSKICIYDPKFDKVISGNIVVTGGWEDKLIAQVGEILKLDDDLELFDVGCNIGVYTITVAQLGRRVVSVDANWKNLRRLIMSLELSNLSQNVTLLLNAVSNQIENVTLVAEAGNVGGTSVKKVNDDGNANKPVTAVKLDDLIGFFHNRKLFMKMDIEGFEWNAFSGGTRFFDVVDVRYVLMEWMHHKGKETGESIVRYLTERSYHPHVADNRNIKLDLSDRHGRWPIDILWIKY